VATTQNPPRYILNHQESPFLALRILSPRQMRTLQATAWRRPEDHSGPCLWTSDGNKEAQIELKSFAANWNKDKGFLCLTAATFHSGGTTFSFRRVIQNMLKEKLGAFEGAVNKYKHLFPALLLMSFLSLLSFGTAGAAEDGALVPLTIDNQVLPGSSKNFLMDPRVFNAEFYRKFYPQLHLANDGDAIRDWTNKGAKACRRGSFLFHSRDYLDRYTDLPKGDCVSAAEHFVVSGFNEGRIGAVDSYWVVFDFNYYVDPANNPDLNKAYAGHTWNQIDLEIHWLQHGIAERRVASPFFHVTEYQSRYADVSRDPLRAIAQYVGDGQSKGRMGRASWADPASWNALVQQAAPPEVSATPNDMQRSFTSARRSLVKVIVKSPTWYRDSLSPPWQELHPDQVCAVPVPTASDDLKMIQTYLDRMATGSKAPCRVVRLAPHAAYHIVLPANLPPNQDWVLNHQPHLKIHNAQDFVFDGNGSTLYFTGSTGGFNVEKCERGIIENLIVDWGNPLDPNPAWRGPLFGALGTIKKDSATSGHIELDPQTEFPPNFSPYIYTFHLWDKASNQMAREDELPGPTDDGCDASCIAQKKGPTQAMRLKGHSLYPNSNASGKWVASNLIQFPNRYVLVAFSRFPMNAVSLLDSGDLRFIRCTIHSSPYMGIAGGDRQRGFSFEGLVITPSQSRHISTTADGVHLTGVLGDVIFDHATFEALGDDAINMAEVWDSLTAVTSANSFSMAGADSSAKAGDTLAFFDEALAFVGSARVESCSGGGPREIQLQNSVGWLKAGLKAINMSHIPSGFYISGVTVWKKIGRGILIGGLHGLIQDSTFVSVTMTGILFHFSSYWSEGAPSSDVAIRNNQFLRTSTSRKFYQYGTGLGTYPHRTSVIAIASEVATNYDKTPDNFNGIYPAFQDIEISGNTIQGVAGNDIYLSGVYNSAIPANTEGLLNNRFTGCGVVPHTDPLRAYFGSESTSAVVLNFVDGISLVGNHTTAHPACSARVDYSSSSNINVLNR
jgi:hypothetical protein